MSELKKVVQNHEERISKLEKLIDSSSHQPLLSGEKSISSLIDSGFFANRKKYGEIIKELKIQAKFDKRHKYKEILNKFTREGKLGRKSIHHQLVYSKK